jgi:XTP/dITP diphosphohydrolase
MAESQASDPTVHPAPRPTLKAAELRSGEPAQYPQLERLINVLAQLRAPDGCAWDGEQTHESLVQYLLEETYELTDAIETGNRDELIEELGDVLYQVIFHSDLAAHTPGEDFTIEDVAAHMTAKMIGRHPHVFSDASAATADEVIDVWEAQKLVEKAHRTSVLDGIPQAMPSLLLAQKLLGRGEKVGVEVAGIETADFDGPADEQALGQQLLAFVATARAQGLDAERALRSALRGYQNEIRAAETK